MTASTSAPQPPLARPALRCLVVDDNADFADSLAELLRHRGHEARTAGSGLGAVAAYTDRPADVIFLDIGLPGLTGHDLARWVRGLDGREGGRRPRLIAVTGSDRDADRRAAAEAGIDVFVVKPLDPARLDDMLAGAAR